MFESKERQKEIVSKKKQLINALVDIPISILWIIKVFIKTSPFIIIPAAITIVVLYFANPGLYQEAIKLLG